MTTTLNETIEHILLTRQLTRKDQTLLMRTFANKKISTTDAALINKIYDALHQGKVRVVD